MKKFVRIILIMVIASPVIGIMITSCAEEADCSLVGRATLMATIYGWDETRQRWDPATLDSLTVTAIGTDSIILNRERNVKLVKNLPLQYTVDTTALVLHFTNRLRDTLFLKHTNTPYFHSMECGYDMQQTIIDYDYTTHVLDSISFENKNTSKNETENMRFYIN